MALQDNSSRKDMIQRYKERKKLGGVYVVRNTIKDKILIEATADLSSSKNRFEFAQKTGSCVDLKLKKDWNDQRGAGFVFEVLEELEKGETQTDAEFSADVKLLKELWIEKMADEVIY